MGNTLLETIDRLFDENKPKEAEQYMLTQLEKAKQEGHMDDALLLLNELIGYYRQTSEKEALMNVVNGAIELAQAMGLQGTIPYATTMVNSANASRSLGMLEQAKEYYEVAEEIYSAVIATGQLSEKDMIVAGLYNNISLLYQELGDFEHAESYQLKSLEIVTENQAGFEIAVSHANLANTYLLAKDYEKSMYYAQKGIELFRARNFFDPHYCAALSALGYCYLQQGEAKKAKDVFTEAAQIVENTFGKNSQYERLLESIAICEKALGETSSMKGMELAKRYYETYGKPMIHEKFPEYEDKIAVGLVGKGSDCFGYDDAQSADHDFGPDFCMWVSDETYAEIGEALEKEYAAFPADFLGYERSKVVTEPGRRGVFKISDFYKKFVGTDTYEKIDFRMIPEYSLAACTNGEVFRDDEGIFSALREKLKAGFPEDIRYLKLAEDVAHFSQTGQYNYGRMMRRGDRLTASLMIADFCKAAMKLYHHANRVYVPHDKWLSKSTALIEGGAQIVTLLGQLMQLAAGEEMMRVVPVIEPQMGQAERAAAVKEAEAENRFSTEDQIWVIEDAIEQLAAVFSNMLYAGGEISDIDSYLDHHVAELIFKSGYVLMEKEELVKKIARLEFEAFDKVQNEGGRASCQNNWPTFYVMRASQYLTWTHEMLVQYLYDFDREYQKGHNLITEKYGRMMESTTQERYDEIKDYFPEISEEKKAVIEQIVRIQMEMVEAFALEHPALADNARTLHTADDGIWDTSYETYLRGEISTYSDKMLQLYGQFVVQIATSGGNLAYMTIENTGKLYGFKDLETFEKGKA